MAKKDFMKAMVTGTPKPLPPIVYAHASVHSIGGQSLFKVSGNVTQQNVENYYSESDMVMRAVQQLKAAGFTIYAVNPLTISIGAPPDVYEKAFGIKLYSELRNVIKELGKEDTSSFIMTGNKDMEGTIDTSKSIFSNLIEGISINEPVYFMNKPIAPPVNYWHLNMPGDVSVGLNAEFAHRQGITGKGVKVYMVDTGWYRHPYFIQRGYRASPVVLGPATANPQNDESGHGTGESANIFAVAPDVNFTMVKMSFVDSAGALNAAVAANPKIISCSWGSSKQFGPLSGNDLVLSATIANAVRSGITVVFSAGNGHFGFPGQHPDVISAGGVYLNSNIELQASDYASGFASSIFPGRNVPDVCGLVGMKPHAAYIMLPVQPGDQIDIDQSAGGAFPNGDQTLPNDGWAVFSGTSAAAPQIAGVCALIKQIKPAITPAQIKNILKRTATDVVMGNCNSTTGGFPAGPGPDLATGYGLVNAWAAVTMASTL